MGNAGDTLGIFAIIISRSLIYEVGRERQVQQQGRQRAEALAERSVEIAQAMVPLAGALARGGG